MSLDWLELAQATGETLYMVLGATLLACAGGLPLGFAVVVTDRGHLWPHPWLCRALQAGINLFRSVPFVVLMITMMPVTRWLLGTSIGLHAAMVPLALGALPFFARLVEMGLREVDPGMIEMGRAVGASNWQIIHRIILPEARRAIVAAVTLCLVTLVGYSAMAGVVGGGGLGDLAIRHGYQRFQPSVMLATTAILVVLVQVFQLTGDWLARRADRRGG